MGAKIFFRLKLGKGLANIVSQLIKFHENWLLLSIESRMGKKMGSAKI